MGCDLIVSEAQLHPAGRGYRPGAIARRKPARSRAAGSATKSSAGHGSRHVQLAVAAAAGSLMRSRQPKASCIGRMTKSEPAANSPGAARPGPTGRTARRDEDRPPAWSASRRRAAVPPGRPRPTSPRGSRCRGCRSSRLKAAETSRDRETAAPVRPTAAPNAAPSIPAFRDAPSIRGRSRERCRDLRRYIQGPALEKMLHAALRPAAAGRPQPRREAPATVALADARAIEADHVIDADNRRRARRTARRAGAATRSPWRR